MVDLSISTTPNVNEEMDYDDLKRPLAVMEKFSRKSEMYSSAVGLLTSFNMCVLFLVGVSYQIETLRESHAAIVLLALAMTSVVLFLSALYVLIKFEKLVAIGNAYYQEISDALEWDKMRTEART